MNKETLRDIALKVSGYFRDFLESDFKRQQAPRRRIVRQTENGFRCGMDLAPYPLLHRDVWGTISRPTDEPMTIAMRPRAYTRPISAVLLKVIEEHIGAIEETSVFAVRSEVVAKAKTTLGSALDNVEDWVLSVQETLADELGTQVVRPLLARLSGPLTQQAYSVIDSLFAAEADLIGRAGNDLSEKLPEVLARYLATQNPGPLEETVSTFLTLDGVRGTLQEFFKSFAAADAYLEFRDLETYVATNDGLQVYLYIGNIKYGSNSYPIFFLPVEVRREKNESGYHLTILSHLFANRRAIDFVLQELAAGMNREWVSPIRERINYLTPEQSVYEVAHLLYRNLANSVDLAGQAELSSTATAASTSKITLSPGIMFAAYERADESLVNDYEAIIDAARRGGSTIVDLFEGLVQGVLVGNPVPIQKAVADEWHALPLVDRLVFEAPIPLNEEQRRILLAVRQPQGKIIVVEGPPGTGKSHTITAIAADCAFNKRSCLVLSDKTEALDVVQNKLSDAMSRVRHDPDFPNPVLRLGRENANFKKLTTTQTYTKIANYVSATESNRPKLKAELAETAGRLKQEIRTTVDVLGNVPLTRLKEMHDCEAELQALLPQVADVVREQLDPTYVDELTAIEKHSDALSTYLKATFAEGDFTPKSLWRRCVRDVAVLDYVEKTPNTTAWSAFERLDAKQAHELSDLLLIYHQLRMPLFGYVFRGAQVRELEARINALPKTRPLLLKVEHEGLRLVVAGVNDLRLALETAGNPEALQDAYAMIARGRLPLPGARVAQRAMRLFQRMDPRITHSLLLMPKDDERLWPLTVKFLRCWLSTRKAFDQAPFFDYVGVKGRLEELTTTLMNDHVDSQLVAFMETSRSDAKALAQVVSKRQKFPEDKFGQVRESFPVIVASIREFGEYMPLLPDLFDVVIIDEASQVSVAQALPALLRGKKIVVLGDSHQFSNVKSSNASIALNDKYRADLRQFFERAVTREAAALVRLSMFDVKRSILEFCTNGASYSVMLRKHFRSYPELISYSSRTFYNGQLQALKIRGTPMEDVVRFDQVEVGEHKVTRGTNDAEAVFILERLVELLDEEEPPTVGVITPFREQHALLSKKLFSHIHGREFEDKLRLKVMTFDSCQGEERNIIFYSLVATPGLDALNYIFPVQTTKLGDTVEEKLKVQRLNVGFSRAQEMVWFVHSMPLESYQGALGKALNHFRLLLDTKDPDPSSTDPSSPMEAKVLAWLQQTPFVQNNRDEIEIVPQFPIGEYLRQLDPTYTHPAWRVDFLITYQSTKGPVRIVVEYDGFEAHFDKDHQVHVGNHERYLNEADIERQLTLESYGYRFLRINRFNLGRDPVATISERLTKLVEMAVGKKEATAIRKLKEQVSGLASKELKKCGKCGHIKPQAAFFDPDLASGAGAHGRVCLQCKESKAARATTGRSPRPKRWRRRWR